MLASAPSFLAPASQPSSGSGRGDAVPAAADEGMPGFAALLDRLSARAAATRPCEAPPPGMASAAVATIAAELREAASAGQAASGDGKDLPPGLPGSVEPTEGAGHGGQVPAFAVLPGNPAPPLGDAGPLPTWVRPAAARRPDRPAMQPPSPSGASAAAAGDKPPASARPRADTLQAEARPGLAVAISTAPPDRQAAEAAVPGGSEPARSLKARTAATADLVRGEASVAPAAAPLPALADAKPSAPMAGPSSVTTPAPPAAADIDAALDHLVAAREALMPAEAAFEVAHAEFGEVSIRIEQKADGRLSAELAGADPELHRAVNAAVAAERSSAAGGESDGGRPAHAAGQRGPSGGSDAAQADRGQPGHDRDQPQRRGAGRAEPRQASSDPRPGIFA